MPAITGMKCAGYYDRHSGAQLSSIQALQSWVDDAVAGLPLPAPAQPVTALDLGSSEGGNAVRLLAAIAAGLRRRTAQPLQAVYSDLASNDFNRLFANLDEARRDGLYPAGVYHCALAGSFYGPLLPAGTVHLATCFNGIHWLDRLPTVTASFRRQAEQDLVRFLECRARELVPGGKLLLASPGATDQASAGDGLSDVLNDACLDLVAAGRLKREQHERLPLPCYFRTVAELLAPLEREGSPVRGAFAIERAATLEVPAPFVVAFRRGGDVAAYAGAYTGFLRAVSEPVARAALGQPEGEAVESL